jgi:hypothetical protein
MRIGVLAATAICAIAATGTARAQSGASTILGGAAPSSIQFKPIDMSSVVATPTLTTQNSNFSFSTLLRRFSIPGLPAKQGISPLPAPSTFPSTSYTNAKMVGTPPYQLGDPRAARFPFLPVIPVLNPIVPITP